MAKINKQKYLKSFLITLSLCALLSSTASYGISGEEMRERIKSIYQNRDNLNNYLEKKGLERYTLSGLKDDIIKTFILQYNPELGHDSATRLYDEVIEGIQQQQRVPELAAQEEAERIIHGNGENLNPLDGDQPDYPPTPALIDDLHLENAWLLGDIFGDMDVDPLGAGVQVAAAPLVQAAAVPLVQAAAVPLVQAAAAPSVQAAAPLVQAAAPLVQAAAPLVQAAAPLVQAAAVPLVQAAAVPLVQAAAAPSVQAAAPLVQAAAPLVQAAAPLVQAAAPSVQAAAPSVQAAAPSVQAAAPSVQAAAPSVQAAAPLVQAAAPSVQAAAPSVQAAADPLVQAAADPSVQAAATQPVQATMGGSRSQFLAAGASSADQAPVELPEAPSFKTYHPIVGRDQISANIVPIIGRMDSMVSFFPKIAQQSVAIASGDEDGNVTKGVWISGIYGTSKQNHDKDVTAYNGHLHGGIIGADIDINDNNLVGAAYSYILSNYKYKGAVDKKVNAKSHIISLYSQTQFNEDIIWSNILSTGFSKVKVKDSVANASGGASVVTGKYNTRSYSLDTRLGYRIPLEDSSLNIVPYIGLKVAQYKDSRYTLGSLSVAPVSEVALIGSIGANIAKKFPLSSDATIIPAIHFAVDKNFRKKESKVKAKFDWMKDYVQAEQSKKEKIAYNIGTNLTTQHKNIDVVVGYNWNLQKKYSAHQGYLKVRLAF